ncbi:hypothetical protein [Fimbriimonas ginsengisoli]|uniref:Lipoprotein n=1 Tax=Fimbriimonas ginsengisoli Gsoil 348 TaxID=661478 RepID=A0A068NNQ9_FIMGI|nr:hypothetical protein [Fimbriimonas ginsengisoli]AIE84395.1 hypothetical protein OP10G_1027 [Fimbriimonas ginsengisoli Gsoil 348]
MRKRLVGIFGLLGLAAVGCAQSDLVGFHKYPEFRTFSGLPGGGFAVTPDGELSYKGAMAFSTPIAYSLGQFRTIFGGGIVSQNGSLTSPFSFRDSATRSDGNGTGFLQTGVSLGKAGLVTGSIMWLSSELDSALNFQFTPGTQTGPARFAAGVQDLTGHGGSSGGSVVGDNDSSRSFYGVATYDFGSNGTYASAGIGTNRFRHGFFNVSTNLIPQAKAYVEYEGWFWNTGVNYSVPLTNIRTGEGVNRMLNLQIALGSVAGKYGYWGLMLSL